MRPLHTTLIAIPLIAASLGLAACGGGGSSSKSPAKGGAATTIDISNFKFVPATVTVKLGSTIRFVNHDRAEHTASATAGGFDTGTLKRGQSKTITVGALGMASYKCQFHPFMTGQIVIVK
jgi:plastocyanin